MTTTAERDPIATAIEVLTEMAERQEHFATPDLYQQMTDAQRETHRFAASRLRDAIIRIKVRAKQ